MGARRSCRSGSSLVAIKLIAEDIPGAELEEPLARHGVPALQWWLICRGIKIPSTWRKSQLIDRYKLAKYQQMSLLTLFKKIIYNIYNYSLLNRICKAVKDNVEIVDVDGSYLYKKVQQLEATGMSIAPLYLLTSPPISGWETISESNVAHADKSENALHYQWPRVHIPFTTNQQ